MSLENLASLTSCCVTAVVFLGKWTLSTCGITPMEFMRNCFPLTLRKHFSSEEKPHQARPEFNGNQADTLDYMAETFEGHSLVLKGNLNDRGGTEWAPRSSYLTCMDTGIWLLIKRRVWFKCTPTITIQQLEVKVLAVIQNIQQNEPEVIQ